MTSTEYKLIIIKSLEQGHDLVNKIQKDMAKILNKMRETGGQEYRDLQNEHYELRNAKFEIQRQMTKFVK